MTVDLTDVLVGIDSKINTERLQRKQDSKQRRNSVVDKVAENVAMIRGKGGLFTNFSISNDKTFLMRYAFKFNVRPFVTTFAKTVTTSSVSLETEVVTVPPNTHKHDITPNPHSHSVDIGIEINEHIKDTSTLHVLIDGIDITNAIISIYGKFIDGYGYFPSKDGTFDILKIVEVLPTWQQGKILSSGFKTLEITQDDNSLCECDITHYIKFEHTNRGGEF